MNPKQNEEASSSMADATESKIMRLPPRIGANHELRKKVEAARQLRDRMDDLDDLSSGDLDDEEDDCIIVNRRGERRGKNANLSSSDEEDDGGEYTESSDDASRSLDSDDEESEERRSQTLCLMSTQFPVLGNHWTPTD